MTDTSSHSPAAAAAPETARPLRLVLDTNVVLDLLHFGHPLALPILAAIESGRAEAVVEQVGLDELERVLTYPQLAITPEAGAALFARYRQLTRLQPSGALPYWLPQCSDRDDQKFLELTARSGADLLVSKDKALLKLRRKTKRLGFAIVKPEEAVARLQADADKANRT